MNGNCNILYPENQENPLIKVNTKDWNKERLIQLKNLFPDLFTNEGKLNIDELKNVIDPTSVSEMERFEFRWFGKSAAKRNAFTPSNATLVYDEARSEIPSKPEFSEFKNGQNEKVNIDNSMNSINSDIDNFIIEGENLEVLKLLSNCYREQIKCIYIDPPYNTGKDFVYSDNFKKEKKPYWEETGVTEDGLKIDTNTNTDGRFHSNWLNMMYSRLLIARTMLRPDGVILISIDDNEVHHLRKLCDEVFGEVNFIGTIINNSTPNARDYGHIGKMHEFCMFYAKDMFYTETNLLEDKDKRFSFKDEIGEFNVHPLYNSNVAFTPENRPNLYYPFYLNPEKRITEIGEKFYEISLTPNDKHFEIYPPKSVKDGVQLVWRWGRDKAMQELNKEIIGYETEEGDLRIVQKMRTSEKLIRSLLSEKEFTSRRGTADVEKIFGYKLFPFPKPVEFIKTLLKVATDKNSIILDFFAGSGTTGQAVMELNQEDGGNRKFILIQIPEQIPSKGLAQRNGFKSISDITIARNKKVVEKMSEQRLQRLKDEQEKRLFDNLENPPILVSDNLGFKVFKLVKSYFQRVEWTPNSEYTDEENIASLNKYIADKEAQSVTAFNRNELLTEILLKNSFQLNYKAVKQEQFRNNEILLATDGTKNVFICLDEVIDIETVNLFKKIHSEKLLHSKNPGFICLERALDTTKKFNLKHYMGDMFYSI